jgi:hypothetical protein
MKNGLIRPLPDEKITATGQCLFLSYCGFLAFQGIPGLFDLLLRRSGIVKAVQRHFYARPVHATSPAISHGEYFPAAINAFSANA